MLDKAHIRIARPSPNLETIADFYIRVLGFLEVGRFVDHNGFDGVMIGFAGGGYHLEFTQCKNHQVQPSPTTEDLLVFYVPDPEDWRELVDKIESSGVSPVTPLNPYWDANGRTYCDPDGYRFVVQNAAWR